MAGRISTFYKRFPKVYWTALSFELLERGAYYSMMPILVVHFYWNVGLPKELCLLLTVFMYPFQYAMPIFTSALAEKVGYKRQMIFGFAVLTGAYIFLSIAYDKTTAIIGMMLIGFGIGCYKPLISSTIAKSTDQKDRNVAYSVYYWIVNFAATFFALTWGLLMLFEVIPKSAFPWIFRVSAIYFLVNIGVALFVFTEVPRSGQVKTLKDVTSNIGTAFKDRKFVLMMLLIAGFWALYSTTLAPFIMIMYGYHFLPLWLPVILLGVINPGTIILLGGPLSKFAEKIESIKLLMGGIFIYLIGLTLITFGLEILPLVFVGMIIYSIGEFMVAPGYLAFVSKLAPKEKVSAYIGCNFLASFTGIFGGALIFGLVASIVGVNMARPHFFYGLLMGFGIIILILFIAYNKAWGQEIIGRAKKIEAMEKCCEVGDLEDKTAGKEPFLFRIFDKRPTPFIAAALIPIILIGTYTMGTNVFYPPDDDDDGPPLFNIEDYDLLEARPIVVNEYATEGQTFEHMENISEKMVGNVTFKLTWTDEPDQGRIGPAPYHENQPDRFTVEVTGPSPDLIDSDSKSNSYGQQGEIEFTVRVPVRKDGALNGTGDWAITITVEAGDHMPMGPGFIFPDEGNDFTLEITYEYYVKQK